MVRECPRCGSLNPSGVQRCACGYDLASGPVPGSSVAAPGGGRCEPTAGSWLPLGCLGLVPGAVLGVMVAVPMRLQAASEAARAVREHEGHVCGLIVLPFLAEGMFLGTLVGGLAGLLASLLLGWLIRRGRFRA